jgi:hypothetical protein
VKTRQHLPLLKKVSAFICVLTTTTILSQPLATHASATPTIEWKTTSLTKSDRYPISEIASTNSTGKKIWTTTGRCKLKKGLLLTEKSGTCTVTLLVRANREFSQRKFSKRFTLKDPIAWKLTNKKFKVVANGEISNNVNDVFAQDSQVYVALDNGLAISSDGGKTFVFRLENHHISQVYGLGTGIYVVAKSESYGERKTEFVVSLDNGNTFTKSADFRDVSDFHVTDSVIYLVANSGLFASTNGGITFEPRNFELTGSRSLFSVHAVGPTVYLGTNYGLAVSRDSGYKFSYILENTFIQKIFVDGMSVYAAGDGLAISNDGGNSFIRRTTLNGLGTNSVRDVYAIGKTVYAALFNGTMQGSGLAVSTDGGKRFTMRTTTNGLGSNGAKSVFASNSKIFVGTTEGLALSR